METTEVSPALIHQKLLQLNRDLAPLGEQIGQLIQKYNSDLAGHGVDVRLDVDWHKSLSDGAFLGHWDLLKVAFELKPMDLPHGRIG